MGEEIRRGDWEKRLREESGIGERERKVGEPSLR